MNDPSDQQEPLRPPSIDTYVEPDAYLAIGQEDGDTSLGPELLDEGNSKAGRIKVNIINRANSIDVAVRAAPSIDLTPREIEPRRIKKQKTKKPKKQQTIVVHWTPHHDSTEWFLAGLKVLVPTKYREYMTGDLQEDIKCLREEKKWKEWRIRKFVAWEVFRVIVEDLIQRLFRFGRRSKS